MEGMEECMEKFNVKGQGIWLRCQQVVKIKKYRLL